MKNNSVVIRLLFIKSLYMMLLGDILGCYHRRHGSHVQLGIGDFFRRKISRQKRQFKRYFLIRKQFAVVCPPTFGVHCTGGTAVVCRPYGDA